MNEQTNARTYERTNGKATAIYPSGIINPLVKEEMSFKGFLLLALGAIFFSGAE